MIVASIVSFYILHRRHKSRVADNDGSGQPAATDYVREAYEIQGRGISRYEMITKANTAELSADGKGVETRAVAIEPSAVC